MITPQNNNEVISDIHAGVKEPASWLIAVLQKFILSPVINAIVISFISPGFGNT